MLGILALFQYPVFCQQIDSLSSLRSNVVILTPEVDTIQLDQHSIVPQSISFSKNKDHFLIDLFQATLIELNNSQKQDTLIVTYRVFPFKMGELETNIEQFDDQKIDSLSERYRISQNKPNDIF